MRNESRAFTNKAAQNIRGIKMEVTTWVAVGVFAAVVGGEPSVSAIAADHPFETLENCKAHLALVVKNLESVSNNTKVIAYGLNCVEIQVKAHDKPNL